MGDMQEGMDNRMQALMPSQPSLPMTGAQRRKLPAATDDPDEDPMMSTYVIPARPSTLTRESDGGQNYLVQLARRRLDPGMGTRRRL